MFDFLSETSFEKHAEGIVSDYMDNGVPMNDSIEKIAKEKELNPDQIKRVVEAANAKAFNKHLGDSDRKEGDVKFDVADPQVVIKRIFVVDVDNKKTESNDEDFFGNMGDFFPEERKATEVKETEIPSALKAPKHVMIVRIKKASDALKLRELDQDTDMHEKIAKLSRHFRETGKGEEFVDFCKTASNQVESSHLFLKALANQCGRRFPEAELMEKTASTEITILEENDQLDQLTSIIKVAHEISKTQQAIKLSNQIAEDIRNGKHD